MHLRSITLLINDKVGAKPETISITRGMYIRVDDEHDYLACDVHKPDCSKGDG